MKCLVTGATGHIGCALVRQLLEEGETVSVFVLPSDDLSPLEGLDIEIIYGDVTNYPSVLSAVGQADIVYHLAGVIGIGSGQKKLMEKVNVRGVENIVRACMCTGVTRLIYTSSVHAIREQPNGQTISESYDFDPKTVKGAYAKTKAQATRIVLEAARRGLNAVIVHPSGVIGPFEYKLSNLGQLVLDFIRRRLKAYIDGGYNFVDVRDVASGIVLAGKKGKCGECYILSGEQVSVKQLLDMLEEITKVRAPKVKLPYFFAKMTAPFAEVYYKIMRQKPLFTAYSVATLRSNSNFSNAKAVSALGWKPRPIQSTLRDTVGWLNAHGKTKKGKK